MKQHLPKNLRDTLAKQYACYVLITCDEPTEDGNMNVQMSYEGDTVLASYLVEGAQTVLDSHHE